MYGAIFGDIMIQQHKRANNEIYYLVDKKFQFSSYTVMAIAVADALLPVDGEEELDEIKIKSDVMQSLIAWGNQYASVDYGRHFKEWLYQNDPLPLNGFDNSAAAMIAAIPYIYSNPDQVKEVAKWVAEITHSDPQSIKNAEIAAIAVYYAKDCPHKSIIKNNIECALGCTFDDAENSHNVAIEAIMAFLDSEDIANVVAKSISLGGDIRTRAVIAGSIAEAFYGIPGWAKYMCSREITEDMLDVLDKFNQTAGHVFLTYDNAEAIDMDSEFGNKRIEEAIARFRENDSKENYNHLMDTIHYRMYEGGQLFVPLVISDREEAYDNHKMSDDDMEYLRLQAFDGNIFVVAFTSTTEELDEQYPDIYLTDIKDFLEEFVNDMTEEGGIILNPNDEEKQFALTEPLIKMLLKAKPPENGMWFFDGSIDELKTEVIVISNDEDFGQSVFEDNESLAAAHFMTKAENGNQYIIHTPLLNYSGSDEKIIYSCYWYCLELAKKCNIHSIAFPFELCIMGGPPILNAAVNTWFQETKSYGMRVLVATGKNDNFNNNDKSKFFKVNFNGDKVSLGSTDADESKATKQSRTSMKSKEKKPLMDYSKGKTVKTSEEAKLKVREFEKNFNSKEEFYQALKELGFKWRGENSNDPKIIDMWARNALARAIDEGFDPFKSYNFDKSNSELHVYIGDITDLEVDAIVNPIDENLNSIDIKIDADIHKTTGDKLQKILKVFGHCNIGEAKITKGYELHAEYVIHIAIDDNFDNLEICYRNCLELAKEYHLHDIAIPITCSERSNIPRRLNILKNVFITANNVVSKWFKENEDYILKVTLVVEYEDQRFFKIGEITIEDE